MKKVSFVVPVYNQPDYFQTCLDAVWFQDYPDIEIILVNDGSGVEVAEAIENYVKTLDTGMTSYAAKYNAKTDKIERTFHKVYSSEGRQLKTLTHETNKGLGAALNTGFNACTGDYCTYMACDDYPYPAMVKRLVEAIESNNADFAFADMNIINDQARILRRFALPDYDFKNTFCNWYFCGICKLYKRELHDKFGMYKKKLLAHDHELYLRFAMNGAKLIHVAEPLAAVRFHDEERLVDNHHPKNWRKLLKESKELVLQARRYAAENDI